MSVVVELTIVHNDTALDLRAVRVTVSRVPSVQDIVRFLATVDQMTKAFQFKVTQVIHNANSNEYPRRDGELDAWAIGVLWDEPR